MEWLKISSSSSCAACCDLQRQPVQFTRSGCSPAHTVKPSINKQQRMKSTSMLTSQSTWYDISTWVKNFLTEGHERGELETMNTILSAVFLALSLLCGVQGGIECIKNEASLCGCQLLDASNNPIINLTLDDVGKKYNCNIVNDLWLVFLQHRKEQSSNDTYYYTYSPCSPNDDCEGNAAVRTIKLLIKSP